MFKNIVWKKMQNLKHQQLLNWIYLSYIPVLMICQVSLRRGAYHQHQPCSIGSNLESMDTADSAICCPSAAGHGDTPGYVYPTVPSHLRIKKIRKKIRTRLGYGGDSGGPITASAWYKPTRTYAHHKRKRAAPGSSERAATAYINAAAWTRPATVSQAQQPLLPTAITLEQVTPSTAASLQPLHLFVTLAVELLLLASPCSHVIAACVLIGYMILCSIECGAAVGCW